MTNFIKNFKEEFKKEFDEQDYACGYIDNKTLREYSQKLISIIEESEHFYLYSYSHFFKKQHKFDTIILNSYSCFNDIFEGIPGDSNEGELQEKNLVPSYSHAYIKCFSEKNNNARMWGEYADGGKGICTEYDLKRLIKKEILMRLFPVVYTEKRAMYCSYDDVEISNPNARMDSILSDEYCWYLNKSILWKDEMEWRIISIKEDKKHWRKKATIEEEFDCISRIICGPEMGRKEKELLRRFVSKRKENIIVVDSYLSEDEYKVLIKD